MARSVQSCMPYIQVHKVCTYLPSLTCPTSSNPFNEEVGVDGIRTGNLRHGPGASSMEGMDASPTYQVYSSGLSDAILES